MRITPQQLQIQLQDVNRNHWVNREFNVGQILNGTITNVEDGQVTFMTEGQEAVTATVEDAGRFVSGQRLLFQVLESNADILRLSVVTEGAQRPNVTPVSDQLDLIQMPDTRENIQAFEVLRSLDMPVTRQSIQSLTQNFSALTVIHEMVQRLMPEVLRNENANLVDLIGAELNLTENSELLNRPIREIALRF